MAELLLPAARWTHLRLFHRSAGSQGLGPHHGQSIVPIESAAEQYQSQARRIVGTSGLDRALLIERQLFAQEQILGRERSSGAQAETQKVD